MALLFFSVPVWAGNDTATAPARTSTLYMSLQDVLAQQAKEKAAREAASNESAGLPPAPPPKSAREAGFTEKLVSGFVKGAARQEALNNPDRDLRPRPEPVSPNAFPR